MPDINRRNNGQKRNLQFKLLAGIENDKKKTLYYTPLIGGNAYDKLMLGLGMYNVVLPAKNLELQLAPMFSIGSGELVGVAGLNYYLYPKKGAFKSVALGLGAKSFHYNEYGGDREDIDYLERYYRFAPSVNFELRKKTPRSPISQNISVKLVSIFQENATFSLDTMPDPPVVRYEGNETANWNVLQATYSYSNDNAINPFGVSVGFEFSPDADGGEKAYAKLSVEGNYRYVYQSGKGLDLRLFTGAFLYNADRDFGGFTFNMATQGFRDNNFDDYYFGRSENIEGLWSQQIQPLDGGFKTPIVTNDYGTSNAFLVALNLKTDLPINLPLNLPLKPYLDVGYFKNTAPSVDADIAYELMYNFGLAVEVGNGVAGIYLPLFSNERLKNDLKSRGNYLSRIGFTVNINRLNPFDFARNLSF